MPSVIWSLLIGFSKFKDLRSLQLLVLAQGVNTGRQWRCPQCGTLHDRDFSASFNLDNCGLVVPVETRCISVGPRRSGRAGRAAQVGPVS